MLLLKKLAQAQKCKQEDIAIILNTQQSEVSKMMNGLRQITEEHIELLIAHFGRDVVESFIVDDDVVDIFSTPQARQFEAKIYPAEMVEEVKAEVISEAVVPIVPKEIAQKASTNIKKFIEENASELEHFDPLSITAEVDGAERVCTTSMATTFVPGDVVFVRFLKDKTHIIDGAMYYFDLKTRPTMIRMVKIVDDDRLLLRALNPRYGDVYISKDEINNIGELKGMYRATFSDLSAEIEEVRRKKDEQVDKLIAQNGEALKIIGSMIQKTNNQ